MGECCDVVNSLTSILQREFLFVGFGTEVLTDFIYLSISLNFSDCIHAHLHRAIYEFTAEFEVCNLQLWFRLCTHCDAKRTNQSSNFFIWKFIINEIYLIFPIERVFRSLSIPLCVSMLLPIANSNILWNSERNFVHTWIHEKMYGKDMMPRPM